MIELSLAEIAAAVGGHIVSGDPELRVNGAVTTDSREISPGGIFVAKPGAVTDGYLFIDDAVSRGARVVVAERAPTAAIATIVVADAVTALGQLATDVVGRVHRAGGLSIVGITGSNGKTTTKNLLREILTPIAPTVAPRASYNNEVGAPTTFLEVDWDTRYLVAEMGASHVGDIARLTAMAPPDIGVVLKVGLAHVGEFGGIENTFRAKSEMVTTLAAGKIAVLNGDDERVRQMATLAPGPVIFFGCNDTNQIRASEVHLTPDGTRFTLHAPGLPNRSVTLGVLGEHHVYNALAATAVALAWGVDLDHIVNRLESVTLAERGRMEQIQARGIRIIHDAYNASPDSMQAAMKTLAQLASPGGRTFAVLGEMSELGEVAGAEHDRIGTLAVRLRLDQLVVVGDAARRIHVTAVNEGAWNGESVFMADASSAFDYLTDQLRPGDVALIKASNSAGLHQLAEQLREWLS